MRRTLSGHGRPAIPRRKTTHHYIARDFACRKMGGARWTGERPGEEGTIHPVLGYRLVGQGSASCKVWRVVFVRGTWHSMEMRFGWCDC